MTPRAASMYRGLALAQALTAVAAAAGVGLLWAAGSLVDAEPGRDYPRLPIAAVLIVVPLLLSGCGAPGWRPPFRSPRG